MGETYRGAPTEEETMPEGFRKRGEPMIMAARRWSRRKRAGVTPTKFGPPTPYYEAGGGWREWK
jgi:hypothetical protein